MNRKSIGNFVEYFSKPLNSDQIVYLNNINNVSFEKSELFCDFIISLFHIVNDTYLGEDVISTKEEITSHFNWCWDKNIKNFSEEKIIFKKTGEHYYYFLNFFTEIFYNSEDKTISFFNEKIIKFWKDIFSMSLTMTKSEYDIFIDVYKMFNKYLSNQLD